MGAVFARESLLSSILEELIEQKLAEQPLRAYTGSPGIYGGAEQQLSSEEQRVGKTCWDNGVGYPCDGGILPGTTIRYGRRQLARENRLADLLEKLTEERLALERALSHVCNYDDNR